MSNCPHHPKFFFDCIRCVDGLREERDRLAQENARLRRAVLSDAQIDSVLERWDETEPAIQREILAALAVKAAQGEAAVVDNARLRRLVDNLDRLLVCYRIGRQPSDKVLDAIARDRKETP